MSTFRPRSAVEYLNIIWRRKLLFLLAIAVMLGAALVVIGRIPDQCQASSSVVVAGKEIDRHTVAARVTTVTQRINSRLFLQPLIEEHNLYPDSGTDSMESKVRRMRRDIKVDTKYRGDNPEMVTVAYRNQDPATAKEVATDLVAAFGKMNADVEQQLDQRNAEIEAEVAAIENRLNQLGQQRAIAAARGRSASRSRTAINSLRSQRIAAASSIETLTDKEYALKQQVETQRKQIEEQEKIARTAPGDARAGSSYGVLLVRKAELEAQVKEYGTQYTEKNPKMAQARTQLAELDNQIKQMDSADGKDGIPITSPEARELRSMNRELSRLQTELEITGRELNRKKQIAGPVPSTVASVSDGGGDAPIANIAVETDRDRLRDRFNALMRRQDEVQRARLVAVGLDPGVFQIVDQPAEPRAPAGPDRMKLWLIGLALALGFGLVVVAVAEIPKLAAVRDERDVRYLLGTPVIGLIPQTLTPEERGRERKLLVAKTIGVLLVGVALLPTLAIVLNQLGVFQLIATRW
jgi:uncharacterized protein involved in exopolysaccharide biosynthesis